jgi:hypothetical protein
MSSIIIGTIVRFKNDPSIQGTVTSLPDTDGNFKVKYRYGTDICQEDEVDIVDQEFIDNEKKFLKELQTKIDDAANAFEIAFDSFQEANKMADQRYCLTSLMEQKLIDVARLEKVVSNGGWNTSSLYC